MTTQRLIMMSRPRFWIYELGPYLLGLAAALPLAEQPSLLLSIPIIAFAIYFLFPANLLIYGINDMYDYETDKLNPKKIAYESLLMPNEHRSVWIAVIATTLPFLFFIDVQNVPLILSFFAFIFFALFYSATPIRAKTKPGLDMVFSAGHYLATGVFGYVLGLSVLNPGEIHSISVLPILAGMVWAMAMHAYSAVPDIDADKKSGIKTVATALTKNPTILLCGLLYSIAAYIAWAYIGVLAAILLVPYLILMYLSLKTERAERLFALYTYFPRLNTIVGMIVFWSIVLSL